MYLSLSLYIYIYIYIYIYVKMCVLTQMINVFSLTALKIFNKVNAGLATPFTTADSVSFFLIKMHLLKQKNLINLFMHEYESIKQ